MQRTLTYLASLALAFTLASCLAPEQEILTDQYIEPADGYDDLLEVHTAEEIRGAYNVCTDVQATYHVTLAEPGGDVYALDLNISGKSFAATVDYRAGSIELAGHGQSLRDVEAESLNSAAVELAETLYPETADPDAILSVTLAENTLVRVLDFLSYIPPGYELGYETILSNPDGEVAETPKRRGNDGVTCVTRGRTYSIAWDDRGGNRSVRDVAGRDRGGNYNCMARCGAGCGRWWVPSSWTLDCFEHDECSRRNNSSGGASDANCGDEWLEAADDWTFGVIRGCSG